MTEEELAAIEARCAATTKGLWESGPLLKDHLDDYVVWAGRTKRGQRKHLGAVGGLIAPVCPPNAEIVFQAERDNAIFIAAAHQDMPALLVEVRRLQALLKSKGEES